MSVRVAHAYTTLEEVKNALKLDDTDDDIDLNRAIGAASRAIDRYCHRRFFQDATPVARRFAIPYVGLDSYTPHQRGVVLTLETPDISTREGVTVAVDDNASGVFGDPWLPGDFELEPFNADLEVPPWPFTSIRAVDNAFPISWNGRPVIKVTARWGWPQVPDDVAEAAFVLSTRLFKRKDAPFGSLGTPDVGFSRIANLLRDPDVTALLNPYALTVLA